MGQVTVNVRLEGPSEADVRKAAQEMGLQISTVKNRGDCCHLYGSKIVQSAAPTVTVRSVPPKLLG